MWLVFLRWSPHRGPASVHRVLLVLVVDDLSGAFLRRVRRGVLGGERLGFRSIASSSSRSANASEFVAVLLDVAGEHLDQVGPAHRFADRVGGVVATDLADG